MAIEYILDASAVLAFLHRETGCEKVERLLDRSTITAVNLSEVLTKLILHGASSADAVNAAKALQLPVIAFDEELAVSGANLCRLAGTHGLSVGDRACLVAARERKLTAITADRSWASLDAGVAVRLIR